MEKFSIPDDMIEKIQAYVKAGRFKDLSDFFTQAAKLLLYAEDHKEEFTKIIEKEE